MALRTPFASVSRSAQGECPLSDLRDERVEVVDKDEVPGVSGVLALLFDEDEPAVGELPHGLDIAEIRSLGRTAAGEPKSRSYYSRAAA